MTAEPWRMKAQLMKPAPCTPRRMPWSLYRRTCGEERTAVRASLCLFRTACPSRLLLEGALEVDDVRHGDAVRGQQPLHLRHVHHVARAASLPVDDEHCERSGVHARRGPPAAAAAAHLASAGGARGRTHSCRGRQTAAGRSALRSAALRRGTCSPCARRRRGNPTRP